MGFGIKNAARWLGLLDEEDDELTTHVSMPRESAPASLPVASSAREFASAPVDRTISHGVNIQPPVSKVHEVIKLAPRNYNEARLVGEAFREGHPVFINVSELDRAVQMRLVDFACGLAFASRGAIERIIEGVYFLSPQGVTVSNEEKRVISSDFFNQS